MRVHSTTPSIYLFQASGQSASAVPPIAGGKEGINFASKEDMEKADAKYEADAEAEAEPG